MQITDGLCHCGCGEETALAVMTNRKYGAVAGQSQRFVRGHQNRGRTWAKDPNPSGLCQCGCGGATREYRTGGGRGVSLVHRLYLPGHQSRKAGHSSESGGSPTYSSWRAMRRRCTWPKHHRWKDYGGRGIGVCERWLSSFESFLADMGERPPGTTLDRIDPDGNYEPGNCRWADARTQRSNRRRKQVA